MSQRQISQCKQILQKNNLKPVRKLGKGAFGLVFLVQLLAPNKFQTNIAAAKCINKHTIRSNSAVKTCVKRQILNMSNINHPNIVTLYQTIQSEDWIIIIMEYCSYGSLQMIQHEHKNGRFSIHQCLDIALEVSYGLKQLHENNIIHRDIKPQNILKTFLQKQNCTIIKICDLGFSKEISNSQSGKTFCGTSYYMAPQILQRNTYGIQVDIWSLGVVLFVMMFGSYPFQGQNILMDIDKKIKPIFKLNNGDRAYLQNQLIDSAGQKLAKMFSKIFIRDPRKRMKLPDLIETLQEITERQRFSVLLQKLSKNKIVCQEIQKTIFLQKVLQQINQANFLSYPDLVLCQYYITKASFYLMPKNFEISSIEQQIKKFYKQKYERRTLLFDQYMNLYDLKKSKEQLNFDDFKDEYRLILGHCFSQAHNCIEKYGKKVRLKLKILCCHNINKIFSKKNQEKYLKDCFVQDQNRQNQKFSIKGFNRWIESTSSKNVLNILQTFSLKLKSKDTK